MAVREYECRKRKDKSAENFAVARHLTLNALKREKTCKWRHSRQAIARWLG